MTIIDGNVNDLIEVKAGDGNISQSLIYYQKLLKPVRTTQIVSKLARPYDQGAISVTTPIHFFVDPPWKQPHFIQF